MVYYKKNHTHIDTYTLKKGEEDVKKLESPKSWKEQIW